MTRPKQEEFSLQVKHTPIRDEYFEVSASTPVKELAKTLSEGENITAAIVVEDQVLKGIIVKDDVLKKAILASEDWESLRAADIMTTPVITIDANADFRQVLDIFAEKSILAVPVVEEGKLLGVCTIFDACNQLYQFANYMDSMLQNIEQFSPGTTSEGE